MQQIPVLACGVSTNVENMTPQHCWEAQSPAIPVGIGSVACLCICQTSVDIVAPKYCRWNSCYAAYIKVESIFMMSL